MGHAAPVRRDCKRYESVCRGWKDSGEYVDRYLGGGLRAFGRAGSGAWRYVRLPRRQDEGLCQRGLSDDRGGRTVCTDRDSEADVQYGLSADGG